MRLGIEYEGYESRQLASLFGKMRDIPSTDSRVDYLMLRTPRMTVEGDDELQEEVGNDVD